MVANGGKHAKKDANCGQGQLIHGLEDMWAVHPTPAGRARPATAGRQQSGLLPDGDWPESGLTRRSKSLTLEDVQASFKDANQSQLTAPAPAEAPSRSWIKPFSRKKKAKAAEEAAASTENSASSAGGRTTFTPAQLQRAASAGLPARAARRPASAANDNGAAEPDAAAAADAAPSGSARRFFTRSSETVAKDRPVSAAAAPATKAEAAAAASEPVERSSKSNTEGSSRWNPFSRSTGKSPAPPEPMAAAAGVGSQEVDFLTAE